MSALIKKYSSDFKTQYELGFNQQDDEIVVDFFCGGGGAATGLEMGLGRAVTVAKNHSPAAISMHTVNHPHAKHFTTDVFEGDPDTECGSRALDEPAPTITAGGGGKSSLVEVQLSPEVEAGALRVAAFLISYYDTSDASDIAAPAATITTRDRLALVTVTIKGTPYVIVDICLRMLQPAELYKAQGFPADYIISHGADGKPFTKTQQVHMYGNSVSPPPMAALARANDPWASANLIVFSA